MDRHVFTDSLIVIELTCVFDKVHMCLIAKDPHEVLLYDDLALRVKHVRRLSALRVQPLKKTHICLVLDHIANVVRLTIVVFRIPGLSEWYAALVGVG